MTEGINSVSFVTHASVAELLSIMREGIALPIAGIRLGHFNGGVIPGLQLAANSRVNDSHPLDISTWSDSTVGPVKA